MASLVANYGESSGSDSASDSEEAGQQIVKNEELIDVKQRETGMNFLSGDVDDDSSNESDSDSYEPAADNRRNHNRLPNPLADSSRLPVPSFLGQKELKSLKASEGSVFANEYLKAEEAKNSILEQHVKLSSEQPVPKRGKKMCWMFQKGRCRHGHKCKYLHGNDINVKEDGDKSDTKPEDYPNSYGQSWSSVEEPEMEDGDDDDSYMTDKKRKKRSGISNTVVPPKKAMKTLIDQRTKERPWTIQN